MSCRVVTAVDHPNDTIDAYGRFVGDILISEGGAEVNVKRGLLGETVVTAQPEYEDVRAAARLTGRPVAEVLAEARRQSGAADRQVLPSRQNGP